ncbi:MAG: phosphoenolpyruvate---glycerone phosphotransferase subunit DhaM [Microbacteriaceae bacterium]|nr:phosphoenolpyruvate---glycerone phosphotransferase subunit DhaM [Microbacteriaceae bacterium]
MRHGMPEARGTNHQPEARRVGLVFVSHSARLADGLVELAGQMAPSTRLIAAGGTADGGIGTSFEAVSAALRKANSGRGVVVLCDLGSAILTAATARDFLEEDSREGIHVVDAPLVEGGVAAAVAAESGADVLAVVAAAESARQARVAPAAPAEAAPGIRYARTVTLTNVSGLHARPAAEFVRLANTFPAKVTVNGKDAKSLLSIMGLALMAGSSAEIVTLDASGEAAVDALADLVESGFGEERA